MTIELVFLLFAIVVVAAYAVQTATGFGAMLVCVTFGAQLIGLEEVIRLMVPLSFFQTGYIVIRHRDGIDWSLLLKRVLPLMIVGMGLAFLLLTKVGGPWLGLAFGLMVLALSARDLHHLRLANAAVDRPISRPASVAALLGAGVIHGIYAAGGPMLVYAIGREGLTKKAFRSTLSMVWIVLNVVLVVRFLLAGDYDREVALDILLLIPTVPLGILVGEWVHHKVDERSFKMVVLVLLIAAAISLIVRYSAQLL
ncbi:MAG: sulfite exporter TauE/SafE family protein [Deltaproteobacteria bacterium]|nr:sulfite exporter TauE/SafE family protein [Deltaproteobacteria bacterium]MBW2626408.1 sulfite exporter TauE/SafE family protein [Deltaproteobacteria bacterium]